MYHVLLKSVSYKINTYSLPLKLLHIHKVCKIKASETLLRSYKSQCSYMAFPLILLHADSFIKQYTMTLFDVSATLSGFINATGYLRMWQRYKAFGEINLMPNHQHVQLLEVCVVSLKQTEENKMCTRDIPENLSRLWKFSIGVASQSPQCGVENIIVDT